MRVDTLYKTAIMLLDRAMEGNIQVQSIGKHSLAIQNNEHRTVQTCEYTKCTLVLSLSEFLELAWQFL